jgi:hypothetical protein
MIDFAELDAHNLRLIRGVVKSLVRCPCCGAVAAARGRQKLMTQ